MKELHKETFIDSRPKNAAILLGFVLTFGCAGACGTANDALARLNAKDGSYVFGGRDLKVGYYVDSKNDTRVFSADVFGEGYTGGFAFDGFYIVHERKNSSVYENYRLNFTHSPFLSYQQVDSLK